jgi:hypothetical protein
MDETTTSVAQGGESLSTSGATTNTIPSSTPESSVATATVDVSTSAPSNSNNDVIASGSGRDGLSLELIKDPVTGKRTIRRAMPQPQEQAPAQAEQAQIQEQIPNATPTSDQAEQAAQNANATPSKYTLDEFSAAIASGNVDGDRVPEEYTQQYANFKIQQAMQAYNEQRQAVEQQKAQVEKQLSPEEQKQAVKDFYARLDAEAKERALKDMELSAEQLEELEFEDEAGHMAYKAAYDWHRQQLIAEVQQKVAQESAQKQAQQAIYQGIMSFVQEARAKEPNFNAIDQIMQTRYKTLPYEQGRAAEDAINALRAGNITEAQTETLRKYYEDVRREYYAEKNKLSTTPKAAPKPPVVETAGTGNQIPKDNTPDYRALRNATSIRDRKAWLSNFLVNRPR